MFIPSKETTFLDLLGHRINDEGIIRIADVLCLDRQCMEVMLVGENNIGNYGAIALAKSLAFCPNLQRIYLHENEIGDDGIIALAEAFIKCPNLKMINIANNTFGIRGRQAVARMLPIIADGCAVQLNMETEEERRFWITAE